MSSGKVSAEAKAFAHVRSDLDGRAVPPEVLNEKEKACWQALVRDKPPEWFSSDCLALLEMLVKEIVRSEWLAERTGASQEELHQADLMGDLEEVAQLQKMFEKWQKMLSLSQNSAMSLATKLRLTPQARQEAKTAANRAKNEVKPIGRPFDFEGNFIDGKPALAGLN